MRDHKYYLEVIDQKQSSPQPTCTQSLRVISDTGFQRVTLLKDSQEFHLLRNSSSTIGHQDGDFWYISVPPRSDNTVLGIRH